MPRWWAKHGLVYWNKLSSRTVRPPTIVREWSDELMLGKVLKTSTIGASQVPCVQVSVTRNEYNKYFHMFFPNSTNFWALDGGNESTIGGGRQQEWTKIEEARRQQRAKSTGVENRPQLSSMGDIVLIRKLLEPFTLKVTHRVEKRIFQHGNLIDPVSGKRVFGPEYEDMRKVRSKVIHRVIDQRLTARQLAAAKLSGRRIEAASSASAADAK